MCVPAQGERFYMVRGVAARSLWLCWRARLCEYSVCGWSHVCLCVYALRGEKLSDRFLFFWSLPLRLASNTTSTLCPSLISHTYTQCAQTHTCVQTHTHSCYSSDSLVRPWELHWDLLNTRIKITTTKKDPTLLLQVFYSLFTAVSSSVWCICSTKETHTHTERERVVCQLSDVICCTMLGNNYLIICKFAQLERMNSL